MSNFFDAVKKAVVCTPNLNFDSAAYQAGVSEPYARLEKLAAEAGAAPSDAQLTEALTLLKTIFDTKRVGEGEQRERFVEILGPLGRPELSPWGGR